MLSMLILVKDFDNETDASLLKTRLQENGIKAYANNVGSTYENHKFPGGHAIAVPNDSFEKALQVLRVLEGEQSKNKNAKANCPNCGSDSLRAGDLVKGQFLKTVGFYWSTLGSRLRYNKADYHVCRACGLEFA
tara:strand:- start:6037 stop:6438 length:402 start_codon:yes stop_codon:yes gene_type:complete